MRQPRQRRQRRAKDRRTTTTAALLVFIYLSAAPHPSRLLCHSLFIASSPTASFWMRGGSVFSDSSREEKISAPRGSSGNHHRQRLLALASYSSSGPFRLRAHQALSAFLFASLRIRASRPCSGSRSFLTLFFFAVSLISALLPPPPLLTCHFLKLLVVHRQLVTYGSCLERILRVFFCLFVFASIRTRERQNIRLKAMIDRGDVVAGGALDPVLETVYGAGSFPCDFSAPRPKFPRRPSSSPSLSMHSHAQMKCLQDNINRNTQN